MVTDPRTGMRTIRPARETFAAVALTGLTLGTLLRGIYGRPGGLVGVILTLLALAVLSRYRISWDEDGICCRTPFSCRRRHWTELAAYSVEPEERELPAVAGAGNRNDFGWLQPCRLRLHGRGWRMAINLKPYSWQDIRHLTQRVSRDVPQHERAAVMVS
jgi:hypothetical protein